MRLRERVEEIDPQRNSVSARLLMVTSARAFSKRDGMAAYR